MPRIRWHRDVAVTSTSTSTLVAGFRHPARVAGLRKPAPVAGIRKPAPVAGLRKPAPVAGTRHPVPIARGRLHASEARVGRSGQTMTVGSTSAAVRDDDLAHTA